MSKSNNPIHSQADHSSQKAYLSSTTRDIPQMYKTSSKKISTLPESTSVCNETNATEQHKYLAKKSFFNSKMKNLRQNLSLSSQPLSPEYESPLSSSLSSDIYNIQNENVTHNHHHDHHHSNLAPFYAAQNQSLKETVYSLMAYEKKANDVKSKAVKQSKQSKMSSVGRSFLNSFKSSKSKLKTTKQSSLPLSSSSKSSTIDETDDCVSKKSSDETIKSDPHIDRESGHSSLDTSQFSSSPSSKTINDKIDLGNEDKSNSQATFIKKKPILNAFVYKSSIASSSPPESPNSILNSSGFFKPETITKLQNKNETGQNISKIDFELRTHHTHAGDTQNENIKARQNNDYDDDDEGELNDEDDNDELSTSFNDESEKEHNSKESQSKGAHKDRRDSHHHFSKQKKRNRSHSRQKSNDKPNFNSKLPNAVCTSNSWSINTDYYEEDFMDAFRIFDTDGNGRITAKELNHVLKELGINMKKKEIKKMIKELDRDGNGTIEYSEFVQMMTKPASRDADEFELREAFKCIDLDGNGYISRSELKEAVKKIMSSDSKFRVQDIEEMMTEADTDGNNLL
jgi:Ca2+-binding EF-hand superfamily protein